MSNSGNRSIDRRQLRLFRASEVGDVPLMGQLLAEGLDVNGRNSAGLSALHFAAGGQEQAVRLLLNRGADVSAVSHVGLSPLMIAARDGYAEIVSLLLEDGADVGATVASVPEAFNQAGHSALSLAADSRIIALLEQAPPASGLPLSLPGHCFVPAAALGGRSSSSASPRS